MRLYWRSIESMERGRRRVEERSELGERVEEDLMGEQSVCGRDLSLPRSIDGHVPNLRFRVSGFGFRVRANLRAQ